jgi:hypothetical protein
MIEVKANDDNFARPLFRFRRYLPGIRAIQVVYGLERRKESEGVEMMSAADFLAELRI